MTVPSSRRTLAVVLAAHVALSAVAPAAAFELFGIKFFERDNAEDAEDVIGDPQAYTVDFTIAAGEHDLEDAIKGASTLWTDREKPASGAAGLLAKARGDYRRILATLYGDGRYAGTISILVDGREAADLPPDTVLPDPASVTVSVDPGPLFAFGTAEVVNPAPPTGNRRDMVDLPVDEGFAPGEPA